MKTSTETQLVFPCVHMNGTGKQTLLDNLSSFYDAIEEARYHLKQAVPNGRDYYIGAWTLKDAMAQHMRRLEAIDAIQKDIEAEMELISEQ